MHRTSMVLPKHILFICRKNSCRSQMAEGFAQTLGKTTVIASSAGIDSSQIDPKTIEVMAEVGIDISSYTAKCLDQFTPRVFDGVVTMCASGAKLPETWKIKIIQEWDVEDPAGQPIEVFRQVRDEIKGRIETLLTLILLKAFQ